MKSFRERDIDCLAAIADFCDRITATYERIGRTKEVFLTDNDYHDALLLNILQIGESAGRLSEECREYLNDLPWRAIIGTRNVIVHGYAGIDDEMIWSIVETDVPVLRDRILDVLEQNDLKDIT